MRKRTNKRPSSSQGRRPHEVVTVPIRGWYCFVAQGTSGTGGLSSPIIGSQRGAAVVDPFNLGERFIQLAECFSEWRFVGPVRFRYLPHTGDNGLLPSVTGASTASNVRSFYWGTTNDAAHAAPGGIQVPSFHGTVARTCAPSTVVGKPDRQWRYTSTTQASPSLPDIRQAAPLALLFQFEGTSSTNAVTYGSVMVFTTIQFRGQSNAGLLGLPVASLPSSSPSTAQPVDEKKLDENGKPSGENIPLSKIVELNQQASLQNQFDSSRRPLLDAKALQIATVSGQTGAKDRVTGGAWW